MDADDDEENRLVEVYDSAVIADDENDIVGEASDDDDEQEGDNVQVPEFNQFNVDDYPGDEEYLEDEIDDESLLAEVYDSEASDDDVDQEGNINVQVPGLNQLNIEAVPGVELVANIEEEYLDVQDYMNQLNDVGSYHSPTFPEKSSTAARLETFYFWPNGENSMIW